ncbi:hypothetical protein [Paraflavitalea speifideaquila]|uniref:hypothetical protein n=1 Tax=Paraflavitalea speifideaquila TaxID=3076558 RepID=UPI0028EBA188|nr:hypothetical protein [Paraflavitalea speifideiaquila]
MLTGTAATGGNGTYAYQWQSSPDNTTFTNIGGATAQNYTPVTSPPIPGTGVQLPVMA